VNQSLASIYSAGLTTTPDSDGQRTDAYISFYFHPLFGKTIRYTINRALDSQVSEVDSARCDPPTANNEYTCFTPFDWETNQWYEMRLEEVAPSQWEASVTDRNSGQVTSAGIITVSPETEWTQPALGINFLEPITAQDCQLGLLPISLLYTPAMANDQTSLTIRPGALFEECPVGGRWNESVKRVDNILVRSMTIGMLGL